MSKTRKPSSGTAKFFLTFIIVLTIVFSIGHLLGL
jgi:hypothetical protein